MFTIPITLLPGSHVLVVEDEFLIAMDIESELTDRGFTVSAASSVIEANNLLDGRTVDMAILDVHLRNDTSFSIADRLAFNGTRFIFLTGSDGAEIPEHLRQATVVPKPFEPRWLDKVLIEAGTYGAGQAA